MSVRSGRVVPGRLRGRAAASASTLPWYGLVAFTFFFVTARLPNLFTEIGIYVALLGLMLRPNELIFPPPLRWALVFLSWALVTVLFSIAPEVATDAYIERLKALVIFFVVVNTVRTPQQLRLYILIILVAFVIYPARGTLQNYVTGNRLFGRAIWNRMYGNPNDLGAITLLMLGLALAIATVKTQSRRIRQAAAALVPVTLLIILLTQSRGVFIGLLVGFGPPLLARVRKRPSATAPILTALVVVALLVPEGAWQRLQGITKLTSVDTIAQDHQPPSATGGKAAFYLHVADESAAQRFEILKTGLRIFASSPILGVGIGCYNEANVRIAPKLGSRDAHNTYVGLAAEMGLPGLLLWLALVGSVIIQVRRRRTQLQADDHPVQVLWIERAIIGYLTAAIFASYAGLTIFYLLLGTLWAAANVLGGAAAPPGKLAVPVRRALRSR